VASRRVWVLRVREADAMISPSEFYASLMASGLGAAFPVIVGRPCELGGRRNVHDEAVAIADLVVHAADCCGERGAA